MREKPGPKNSLGLVKFMFPNQYDIYLHSTPEPELFTRSRRDFSHGCIRVQKPEDLAVWVLANSDTVAPPGKDWDADTIHQVMTNGPDNHQVNLKTPIPIVIFYATGIVAEDGQTHLRRPLRLRPGVAAGALERAAVPDAAVSQTPKIKPGDTA